MSIGTVKNGWLFWSLQKAILTIERSTSSKAFRCCLITSGAVPDNKRNIRNQFAIQCDDRNSEEVVTIPPNADRTEPARDMPPVPIIALNNIIKSGIPFRNSDRIHVLMTFLMILR